MHGGKIAKTTTHVKRTGTRAGTGAQVSCSHTETQTNTSVYGISKDVQYMGPSFLDNDIYLFALGRGLK